MSLSPENKALIERALDAFARAMWNANKHISTRDLNRLLDAARQEGARGGEPVAWRVWCANGECFYQTEKPSAFNPAHVQPLYASPAEPSGWRRPSEGDVLQWLRRSYVSHADERQKAMGLSYTTAETEDLARGIARFVATWAPHTSEGRTSPAWLIERSDLAPYPLYLRHTRRGHGWTPDHDEATRFSTKAEAISECCGGNESGPLRVVEHMRVSAPTSEGGGV